MNYYDDVIENDVLGTVGKTGGLSASDFKQGLKTDYVVDRKSVV